MNVGVAVGCTPGALASLATPEITPLAGQPRALKPSVSTSKPATPTESEFRGSTAKARITDVPSVPPGKIVIALGNRAPSFGRMAHSGSEIVGDAANRYRARLVRPHSGAATVTAESCTAAGKPAVAVVSGVPWLKVKVSQLPPTQTQDALQPGPMQTEPAPELLKQGAVASSRRCDLRTLAIGSRPTTLVDVLPAALRGGSKVPANAQVRVPISDAVTVVNSTASTPTCASSAFRCWRMK